jgi:hypothetical protein
MPTMITSLPTFAGALLAFGLSAAPAQALNAATWVSGHGTDSGACTLAAPCRTFAFALTQTAAGGLIDVLDPAGYGLVTITKAISILNDGVGVAGIGTSAGNAITINAGASDVHLRGLTIEGLGTGTNGIFYSGGTFGGTLAIENCVIRNFAGAGIFVGPTGSAVISGVLSKVITNNNGVGIVVNGTLTTGASLNVTIVDSEASNNGIGINVASANTAVTVRNVVASNNGNIGLLAQTKAILRVAHSVVTGSNIGVQTLSGGTLFSYGDNDIDGNTTNNTAVLTTIPTH